MHLTVVVPTFNRASSLERALERLLEARASSPCGCDLVVVDNNSADATAAVVARFGDRVRDVFESRHGLAHARNIGISAAVAIGMFAANVQRVRDSIGSTEDHELLARLCAAGDAALYVPDLVVWADVASERLTRRYHRRWHHGHGRFHATMQLPDMERSRGRIFGVPRHLIRSAARDAVSWLQQALTGDSRGAFAHETRLWFFSGFVRERCTWLPHR